mmetsp:Transcript_19146/g.43534  ORF Transcript_19146/g.43534 Transcript_19146/m.43534 type:complete len:445 (-) Transcript_19146:16-1350(-)
MPVAFITVKLPDGAFVHLDIDLSTRVEDFRTILAPKSGVKRHRQRLVFSGRLLQDGRSLEAYGVERNSTIHLLHSGSGGEEGPDGHDITQIPPRLAAQQRHVLQNPDILQQMLESPAMQSLLNDHDFMRSLLKMDPHLQKLLENCPDLQQMLHEEEFMKQATEALRNPVHVRDVLRSTDRSMSQLENLGGGAFDVLRQMAEDIRRPQEEGGGYVPPTTKKSKGSTKSLTATQLPGGGGGATEEAVDGEGTEVATVADLGPEPPEWLGSFDTNAMASMMQDQNMQQLLSQLVQTLGGPTVKLHPDDPFLDSSFIGQMFHAQTISSMTHLQASVEKLSLTADAGGDTPAAKGRAGGKKPDKGGKDLPHDSPAVLSGLHPKSPAANFKESFNLFVAAEQESPEIRYKGQLAAMGNMGFTDKEANIQALHSCDGNMSRAVEFLMANQK